MTKNEIYSLLTFEGVSRGYEVIAEYAVSAKNREISADLVWTQRRPDGGLHQDRANQEFWRLIAAFEIEGCNVPMPTLNRPETEFTRHVGNFKEIRTVYPEDDAATFVVLYTEAYDRIAWPQFTPARIDELVNERTEWNGNACHVLDGRVLRGQLTEIFGNIPGNTITGTHWNQ